MCKRLAVGLQMWGQLVRNAREWIRLTAVYFPKELHPESFAYVQVAMVPCLRQLCQQAMLIGRRALSSLCRMGPVCSAAIVASCGCSHGMQDWCMQCEALVITVQDVSWLGCAEIPCASCRRLPSL